MISRHACELVCYVALTLFTVCMIAGSDKSEGIRSSFVQDPLPEVSMILKSNGFDPVEVRPPSHRFLLSIDNRSGVNDLILRLNRADGSQVQELHVTGAAGDWNETLDLSAGTYTLSEANHSTWYCTIIVQ